MHTSSIEIWANKKLMVVIVIALPIIAIVSTWYLFATDKYAGFHFAKIVQPIVAIYALFQANRIRKTIQKKLPFIIIAPNNLTINYPRTQETFDWSEISYVSHSEEDNNSYLVLQLSTEEKKIGISLLSLRPSKIVSLIEEYHQQALRST